MYDGELIRLRAYEPTDVDALLRWVNDPALRPFLSRRYPFSRATEEEWARACATPSFGNAHFVIEARDTGEAIGTVALRSASAENRSAELGIQIAEEAYRDRGYGTDAMRTTCQFGFVEMGLHRIQLWVQADNPRARHVYRNLGFVEEGVARQARRGRPGWTDMVLMGILEGELT